MKPKYVTNIKLVLFLRFLCGYYYEMEIPRRLKTVAKAYCIFFLFFYLVLHHLYCSFSNHTAKWSLYLEYSIYVFMSLYSKKMYLMDYYTSSRIIDFEPHSRIYKKLNIYLAILIPFLVVLKIVNMVTFCLSKSFNCWSWVSLLHNLLWNFTVLGRIPPVFVFALLFCRTRIIRRTLVSITVGPGSTVLKSLFKCTRYWLTVLKRPNTHLNSW